MNFRIPHGRRLWLFLITGLVLFATGMVLDYRRHSQALNFGEITLRAQDHLNHAEEKINKSLKKVKATVEKPWINIGELSRLTRKGNKIDHFALYVFEKHKLVFWSDNRVVPDSLAISKWKNHEVINYKNGWYYVIKENIGNRIVAGLYLLKNQYPYQNKYIVNEFNPVLKLPEHSTIAIEKQQNTFPVYNKEKQYLFSVGFDKSIIHNVRAPSAACYMIAIAFIFIFILNFLVLAGRVRSNTGFIIIGLLALARWWMINAKVPESLYQLELFSPKYYASSYLLNSLGDLLLTTLVLSLFTVYLYIYVGGIVLVRRAKVKQYTWSVVVIGILLITFLFSVFINYLLSGLIINSQISFNINNVFELTSYSIIGIFITGILLFCFYLVCDGAVRFIQKTHFSFGYGCILFLITQGIFLMLLIWLRDTEVFINYGVSSFLLANILILFTTYIRRTSRRVFSFTRSLLIVLGFSVYAAQMIHEFNITKERERRILLAGRLENEHDLIAEYLFTEAGRRIKADSVVNNFLALPAEEHLANPFLVNDLQKRLLRLYFSGYLGKYDVQFKFFDINDSPVNSAGDPSWDLDAIIQNINNKGSGVFNSYFYYVNAGKGRLSYTGIIPVGNHYKTGTLVVEVNARLVQDRSGLPELLLSNEISSDNDLQSYSFARYENNTLVSQSGSYNYYLTPKPYEHYYIDSRSPVFRTFDNYSHLFYRTASGGLIIISYYNLGIVVYITLFSYIFTFFSILYIFIYLLVRLAANNLRLLENFKSRIQFSIVSIVIVALVMVGGATITYIINNYTQQQNNRIREKLNDTVVLVENELNDRRQLESSPHDELVYALNRLSTILSLDFNIYSTGGNLLFTSQPKFYEQDITANVMNPFAFIQLTQNPKGIYIQNEKVASFEYISAYEPIRNMENRIIGYINLPYYARQTELNREISSFLVALINIYVLLFSVAVVSTFIISNRITQPLRIIQQSLKRTKLGRANEPLIWKRNDEIGSLVNEYNRMLEELQQSADKLARSEREHAWREMAKQVAHEIKNPLTPMKLSVQHLQRAYRDNHPKLPEMVDRISIMLIEQIETLSSIASAFSDFAKMPKANNAELDFLLILENIVHLYSENEQVKVFLEENSHHKLTVFADKDHLIRIFSNLIKNGIQAIKSEKQGFVKVSVETFIDHYVVAVEDNGQGISPEQVEKIFVPNFTTKTTGTGLGLAMVKNLVEGMNGEVWFETEEHKGTVFYVRIPAFKHHDK